MVGTISTFETACLPICAYRECLKSFRKNPWLKILGNDLFKSGGRLGDKALKNVNSLLEDNGRKDLRKSILDQRVKYTLA